MMQVFSLGVFVGFIVTTAVYLVLDRVEVHGSQRDIQKALVYLAREQSSMRKDFEKVYREDH